MSNGFLFPRAIERINSGLLDWPTVDVRAGVVMANTLLLTSYGIEFVGDLSAGDLDECNGSSYGRIAILDRALLVDAPTKSTALLAETVAGRAVFAAFGAGSRDNVGVFFYEHVGADAVNPLIGVCYGTPWFPFNGAPNGMKFVCNPAGVFRFRNRSV